LSKRTIVKKTKGELLKQLFEDATKDPNRQKTSFKVIDVSAVTKTKPFVVNTVRLPPHLTIEKLT